MPKEFYASSLNLRFYRYCEQAHRRYGILSDLYGIHFDDEPLPFYDLHPSQLSDARINELGGIIGKKCSVRKIKEVVFYNTSPIMSHPYLRMLAVSGLITYFTTQLPKSSSGIQQVELFP